MTSRPPAVLCSIVCAVLAGCGSHSTPAVKKPSPVTLIKFSRTGGVPGAIIAGTVAFSANHAYLDAEGTQYRRELGAQELKQLRADAQAADFDAAKSALDTRTVPDAYQFEISVVTENGASRSLTFDENSIDRLRQASPAVARLALWVEREAGNISSRI